MQKVEVGRVYPASDGHKYYVFRKQKEPGSYAIARVNMDAWCCVAHSVTVDEQGVLDWDTYTCAGFLDRGWGDVKKTYIN